MIFSFTATKREEKDVDALRIAGKLPAVVYGAGMEPISLTLDYVSFAKLFNEAGESSLIDLAVDGGKTIKVLIQDLQHDPVKGKITHVDFRQINMNKEMTATIELKFVGESMAIKSLGGTLIKAQDDLDVKCLPKDLVSEVEVDLSILDTFEKSIHVKDLVLPAGIVALEDPSQLIAKVAAPLSEEELKAMDEAAAPSIDQIEVEKKGKEEVVGEEGKDGDAKKDAPKKDEKK
ncbi:MAG: 50S ribosomal protein L25 [Candidatus Magasanikbacteria bacterium GW2011_GWC2_37_14]|uniref:Large ribosomal subunit protein bL25 n=1 Tax=Candidatus Magasanikbacteria bacterium GW2011_GWC2_37_14 TaxID=1619046 RepID=A0A0G0GLF4_9BACT|nr:MAG: 50S ribosomal protein L25 [Candidatus Magasanikbacteria bacterium GW2011_GWC2_37_14]